MRIELNGEMVELADAATLAEAARAAGAPESARGIAIALDGEVVPHSEWESTPLREGASDAQLADLIRFAVRHKELKHRINDSGFVRASRSMSQSALRPTWA